MTSDKISRRTLGGLAAAGVGVPLLAACSNGAGTAADPAGSSSSGAAGSGSGSSTSAASGAGAELTPTSDIEVGGGEIFTDQEVVVTQPSKGQFKCFTAVCSHQGCIVSTVSDGTINCACHGSQYSIKDGSVVSGPATFPLAEVPITVSSGEISLT